MAQTTEPPAPEFIVTSDGKSYQEGDFNGMFKEYHRIANKVRKIESKLPPLYWEGAKIPYAEWQKIVAFFLWSQNTHKSEALVNFLYHPVNRQWAVFAPPQIGRGMTVSARNKDEDPEGQRLYNEQRSAYGRGWRELGTIHHHCTTSAFQSGTDHTDEVDRPGIHITLGHITSPEFSQHIRAYFNGQEYELRLTDIVDGPEWLNNVPVSCEPKKILEKLLISPVTGVEVPQQWKDNFQYQGYTSSYTGYTGGANTPFAKKWKATSTSTGGFHSTEEYPLFKLYGLDVPRLSSLEADILMEPAEHRVMLRLCAHELTALQKEMSSGWNSLVTMRTIYMALCYDSKDAVSKLRKLTPLTKKQARKLLVDIALVIPGKSQEWKSNLDVFGKFLTRVMRREQELDEAGKLLVVNHMFAKYQASGGTAATSQDDDEDEGEATDATEAKTDEVKTTETEGTTSASQDTVVVTPHGEGVDKVVVGS